MGFRKAQLWSAPSSCALTKSHAGNLASFLKPGRNGKLSTTFHAATAGTRRRWVRSKRHLPGQVVYVSASGQGEGRAVCTGEGTVTVGCRFHAFPAHVVFLSKVTRQKRQHTLGGVKARPHLPGSGSCPLKLGGPGFI